MILGLTGAFGSGKSTVLNFFAQKQWHIFDADSACHQLYDAADGIFSEKVREIFGSGVFRSDGSIDRKAVAAAGFTEPEKLEKLTSAIYPALTERLLGEIADCRKNNINGIFEIPLMYESGFEKYFEMILALWCDPQLREIRLAQRGYCPDDVAQRDAKQLPPELKLEKADFAVINNGSREFLFCQLEELLKKII